VWSRTQKGLVQNRTSNPTHTLRACCCFTTVKIPEFSFLVRDHELVQTPRPSLTTGTRHWASGTYCVSLLYAITTRLPKNTPFPAIAPVVANFFCFPCARKLTNFLNMTESIWVLSNTSRSFRRRSRAMCSASFCEFAAGRLVELHPTRRCGRRLGGLALSASPHGAPFLLYTR